MNMMITRTTRAATAVLLLSVSTAAAAPLRIVAVAAPGINCVFNPSCQVTAREIVGNIPMPGVAGVARLQSRTFVGVPGSPGAGKTAYQYRLDLTQALGAGNFPCISALRLDFGANWQLPYEPGGALGDVYVVMEGGAGSIDLAAADRLGNVITIVFGRPVCAGTSPGGGDSTYFFGLAAQGQVWEANAQVQIAGGLFVDVPVHVPRH